MATPYDNIPDDIKEQSVSESSRESGGAYGQRAGPTETVNADAMPFRKQRRIFKKKRAGVVLSRDEVKAIKVGRKKLRKEMRARGIRDKREFEVTAASLGLYFDKRRGFLAWLWGHWLGLLIGAFLALLAVLFLFSIVQKMRGRFTINMSDEMFKEGFVLDESAEFPNPTTILFATAAEDLPCISLNRIPADVDMIDGQHNDSYFAYTYYIRNEGENTVGYTWQLDINQETLNLSSATWVVVFEDGEMRFYAKANGETGDVEALPAFGNNRMGYMSLPLMEAAPYSDQFEVVDTVGHFTYYRAIPDAFLSDTVIAEGTQEGVAPMDVHKYTVVLYLEGDDPDCTDELIDGTMGVEMNFRLTREEAEEDQSLAAQWKRFWDRVWNGLVFWD